MCVSLDKARFSRTFIALTRTTQPESGREVHSLMYRNAPLNRAPLGHGNAMLLHFPAAEAMDERNVVDTTSFAHCTSDILGAVEPAACLDRTVAHSDRGRDPLVFEHGIYHVVLARHAEEIPDVLDRVPAEKRPRLNAALFAWFGEVYPGYTFALCCFDTRRAVAPAPLLWWYVPWSRKQVMLPGVDSHDGGAPRLRGRVPTDHWVVLGSDRPAPGMRKVTYTARIPTDAAPYLPRYATGRRYVLEELNRDFVAPVEALDLGDTGMLRRDFLRM